MEFVTLSPAVFQRYIFQLGLEAYAKRSATCDVVVLLNHGAKKIECIKVIRKETGLGLKEAKDLSEQTPSTIRANVDAETGKRILAALVTAGATAELR
mgnify:CR=1 FL=1